MSGLAGRLAEIEARIASACARAGRARDSVVLIPASKFQPLERMREAIACGLVRFGENRVQEARDKAAAFPGLEWHLLGPLQSNKARLAAELFSTVHAIDRLAIATALDREAGRRGGRIAGFLEVNLGGEASKHGFSPEDLLAQAASQTLTNLENLDLVGLMAIPPPSARPELARPWFAQLRELAETIGARGYWPGFRGYLSMGMSDDFAVAIEEGATHVRIGTALFGSRAVETPRPS